MRSKGVQSAAVVGLSARDQPGRLGPGRPQRDARRSVVVGGGFDGVSSAMHWWRGGYFDSPAEARGAFKLAHQQALDGMGEGGAHWMGLNESEFNEWMRKSLLPCDVVVPADGRNRVYFLRDLAPDASSDYVKIGTSNDVASRISNGQTMNPRELVLIGSVLGDRKLEVDLHRRFESLRVRGEWFETTRELLAFIDGLLYAESLVCSK